MTFPAAVPEIPAANVDKAVAYYVNTLGFTFDWGDDQGGIAGISRGNCRLFITNRSFRESYGNIGPILFWLNLDSKAEVDELFEQWKAAKRRSFPSPRTNLGICTSLWLPILMATSFVSSMISGATSKRTTSQKGPTALLGDRVQMCADGPNGIDCSLGRNSDQDLSSAPISPLAAPPCSTGPIQPMPLPCSCFSLPQSAPYRGNLRPGIAKRADCQDESGPTSGFPTAVGWQVLGAFWRFASAPTCDT